MMNFFKPIFILGLINLTISSSAQVFVDTTKVWSLYTCNDTSACDRRIIKLKGDTLIASTHYTKFIVSQDSGNIGAWVPVGVREDVPSKKIYFYNNSAEYLAYDFSLNVNDTFRTDMGGCQVAMVVNAIDSITLETGEKRKRIFFSSDTWIEGIGSLYGPIYSSLFSCTFSLFPELICELENDTVKYHNTAYESCFSMIGIDEVGDKFYFNLYPNPAHSKSLITLKCPANLSNAKISIYDITGREVFQQNLSKANTHNITLSGMDRGIYIVRVTAGGVESTMKFMIE